MRGKLAFTASSLIVWFHGLTLINVLAKSFESLQPHPFYDIIADPVKRTKQVIFLMERQPSRSLWNYNFLSVSGRKPKAFLRAHRCRGCSQHIIVSQRNSSTAKKSAEMGTEPSGTPAAFPKKTGHGHFLPLSQSPELGHRVTVVEIKTGMTFADFKGVSQHLESSAAHKNSPTIKGRMVESSSSQIPRGLGWLFVFFMIVWVLGCEFCLFAYLIF